MAQVPHQIERESTQQLRSQIEHTRAEMSETIDAIQGRLSPGRLMTDAKETVKEAAVDRAKRVAANPIPFAMVGMAATALAVRFSLRSRTSRKGLTGNERRLLVAAAAALACLTAWRANSSR